MLPNAEDVETHLICQFHLLEQICHALLGADGAACLGIERHFSEGSETDFHRLCSIRSLSGIFAVPGAAE